MRLSFIAHIRSSDGEIQTVAEHLTEVRELAERNGRKLGMQHVAGLAGLLHDAGKNTDEFKTYIQKAVADPGSVKRGSVDHSTSGGRLLYERYYQSSASQLERITIEWAAMAILGHHGGLLDFINPENSSDFIRRTEEKQLDGYEQAAAEFFSTVIPEGDFDRYVKKAYEEAKHFFTAEPNKKPSMFTAALAQKFIFSCLIDADRTNTRDFDMNQETGMPIDSLPIWQAHYEKLMRHIGYFQEKQDAAHPINRLRSEMSEQCSEHAELPSGIYTLSIPTGGGKTLASLRYALKHAQKYRKDRIIYILPYTTIIEQNAQEIRRILGDEDAVLEHHSNIISESGTKTESDLIKEKKLQLMKDNWDSPVIFTTMVQFLNTFYSSGTRNVRRLHNLTNSILIFDEVQSVPVKCISLFNEALNFLKDYGNSSILLCTATQPGLDFVKKNLQLSDNPEIIKNLPEASEKFKRVQIVSKLNEGPCSASAFADSVLNSLEEIDSVLVILNTKSAARKLYGELQNGADNSVLLYHLSTGMCPAHRKQKLECLRSVLDTDKKVVCVSTQLIEAGVDISFDCVYRSLAGLDSIAQAAGRCNRHGKDPIRNVYVIKSADEDTSKLEEITHGKTAASRVFSEFEENSDRYEGDLLSATAMRMYFQYYYHLIEGKMNYVIPKLGQDMHSLLGSNATYRNSYVKYHGKRPKTVSVQAFKTAGDNFEVIDSPTTTVLVPYSDEGKNLIADFNGDLPLEQLGSLLKKAQHYSINLFDTDRRRLEQNGDMYPLFNGEIFALTDAAYNDEFGMDTGGEGRWETAIF
ncbi:CRISPR-associated helicase Cas3' [Indiicoccus explosivorum]|uniref:CRISPR-associated helicase Cas3' n=1 Tax=Indiicoccus explosivorum TaxID=1917864 RepID=UPI001F4DABFA|nr:CRISPR-associated helicase Cas3' [Indiicoccus explosivorum]